MNKISQDKKKEKNRKFWEGVRAIKIFFFIIIIIKPWHINLAIKPALGGGNLKSLLSLGVKTCTFHHMLIKGECAGFYWVTEKVVENGLLLWTSCDARQWFSGKGEGLSLKKQRSVGWEEANWEFRYLGRPEKLPCNPPQEKSNRRLRSRKPHDSDQAMHRVWSIRKVLLKCFYLFIYLNLFFGCVAWLSGS